jgi:hypothetical protein
VLIISLSFIKNHFCITPKLPAFVAKPIEEFSDFTEINASADTDIHARRLFTSVDSVIAEVTFLCNPFLSIKLHHPEGTGLNTIFTSNAGF